VATVTTIIPTFRRPELLKRALDSALNNSRPPDRIEVWDNASGDGTVNVVEEFSLLHPGLIFLTSRQENIGPVKNMLGALQAVQTDYFHLLNDDDLIHPEFIAESLKHLEQFESAGFSTSLYVWCDANNKLIDEPPLAPIDRDVGVFFSPANPTGMKTLMEYRFGFNGTLFRTTSIKSFFARLTSYRGSDAIFDRLLLCKMGLDLPFVLLNKPLGALWGHTQSVTILEGSNFDYRISEPLGYLAIANDAVNLDASDRLILERNCERWYRDRMIGMLSSVELDTTTRTHVLPFVAALNSSGFGLQRKVVLMLLKIGYRFPALFTPSQLSIKLLRKLNNRIRSIGSRSRSSAIEIQANHKKWDWIRWI
jgi:glycosyltransferase involved in cell wall biosynthesis